MKDTVDISILGTVTEELEWVTIQGLIVDPVGTQTVASRERRNAPPQKKIKKNFTTADYKKDYFN